MRQSAEIETASAVNEPWDAARQYERYIAVTGFDLEGRQRATAHDGPFMPEPDKVVRGR